MELGVAAETKKPTSVVLMLKTKTEGLSEKFEKLHEKIFKNHPFFWKWSIKNQSIVTSFISYDIKVNR